MSSAFVEPSDATPLTPEEREGLKQPWVTTRSDLNTVEQANILKGMNWANKQRHKTPQAILNEDFILQLHKHLFGDVWTWAGKLRGSERNIGIPVHEIRQSVHMLCGDVEYWIENKTFEIDEIAVRLHHKLVFIHPFPNGNGRHTRLMADLLHQYLGGQYFSWGGGRISDSGESRTAYITALKSADNNDIQPLLKYAKS